MVPPWKLRRVGFQGRSSQGGVQRPPKEGVYVCRGAGPSPAGSRLPALGVSHLGLNPDQHECGCFHANSWFFLGTVLWPHLTDRDAEASSSHLIRPPSSQKAPHLPRPQRRKWRLRASDTSRAPRQEAAEGDTMGLQICTCLISSLRDPLPAPHQNGIQDPHGPGHSPTAVSQATEPAKCQEHSPGVCVARLQFFVMVPIGTVPGPALLHPSQLPSPWPSPSRQLVVF